MAMKNVGIEKQITPMALKNVGIEKEITPMAMKNVGIEKKITPGMPRATTRTTMRPTARMTTRSTMRSNLPSERKTMGGAERLTIIGETVNATLNFRSFVTAEDLKRDCWINHWGWILEEYRQMNNKLKDVRDRRRVQEGYRVESQYPDRSVLPFPKTTSGQYGWLATKPDFKLEVYRPGPLLRKIPFENPNLEEDKKRFRERELIYEV